MRIDNFSVAVLLNERLKRVARRPKLYQGSGDRVFPPFLFLPLHLALPSYSVISFPSILRSFVCILYIIQHIIRGRLLSKGACDYPASDRTRSLA